MAIPTEILVRIMKIIHGNSMEMANEDPDNWQALALFRCALVCRHWHAVANELLWRDPMVDERNMAQFILGVLYSRQRQLRDNQLHFDHQILLQTIERISECYRPLEAGQVRDVVEEAAVPPSDLGHLGETAMLEVFKSRVSQATLNAQKKPRKRSAISNHGAGNFVRTLDVPSWDPMLNCLSNVLDYLPNCTAIKFTHPPHGPEFIPTLSPSFLRLFLPYIANMECLSVEDIDVNSWYLLLEGLATYGSEIKILNLEAISEKDKYHSTVGLSTVFPNLKKLECIRMDRVPVGSSDFPLWGGTMDILIMAEVCTNLRAVILDYCDLSLECLSAVWNNCVNLGFLGAAGLKNLGKMATLTKRSSLKTLRFVDCQISDSFVYFI